MASASSSCAFCAAASLSPPAAGAVRASLVPVLAVPINCSGLAGRLHRSLPSPPSALSRPLAASISRAARVRVLILGSTFTGTPVFPGEPGKCVAPRSNAVRIVRRGGSQQAEALFGRLFGGREQPLEEYDTVERKTVKYHEDVPLHFPKELLAGTFLEGRELRCCYRLSSDGPSAADFHRCADFTGPCVVWARTDGGARVGGFSPEGFRSTDDYYDSLDAFLFYWPRKAPESGPTMPVILRKIGGSGAALFDYARGGPQFGADGLILGPPLTPVMGGFTGPDSNQGVGTLTQARSRLGLSYERRPDGLDSLFGEERMATVVEVLVFCAPEIASLY